MVLLATATAKRTELSALLSGTRMMVLAYETNGEQDVSGL